MTYKYKDDVKRVLFEQQRVEQNPSVLNTTFNMRDELNEVYRKAEAFELALNRIEWKLENADKMANSHAEHGRRELVKDNHNHIQSLNYAKNIMVNAYLESEESE